MSCRVTTLCCCLVLSMALAGAPPLAALNGHFVYGVGARNAAMGGAGVALGGDPLTALAWNPALLTTLEDYEVQMSFELIKGSPEVSSEVTTPFGVIGGTTQDDTGLLPIPAFGITRHAPGSQLAFGLGSLALAGFSTDYPQDPSNPVLAPQPAGFGRVSSEYQYLRIPLAVAYQVSPSLSVGGALTLGYARLSATPAAFAAPDCAGPTSCFFPAANAEGAYGWGVQLGIHYRATPTLSFGASYISEQQFEDFSYNSEVANPALPTFGTARSFDFNVDVPAQAIIGLAWEPTPSFSLALDGKWVGYDGVEGLGTFGFNPDGSIQGFGWDDILVGALGVEWRPSAQWAFRAGYNYSESPIVPERTMFSVPAPATFQDHVSLGIGARVSQVLTVDATYYRGFENEVSGPIQSPFGPVPGTQVTQRNSADSVVTTVSLRF